MIQTFLQLLAWFCWAALWAVGGVWMVRAAFRLQPREQMMIGIAVGFVVQNSLVNWLARVLPLPLTAWLAAALVFLVGAGWRIRQKGWRSLRVTFSAWQLLIFAIITAVYYQISRGLAIFDDYAHLPTVSIMATGDIPPHFPLDPQVVYGYHHFLLLFSAQVMRVAHAAPWEALDVGRALTFGLSVMLAALWVGRLTRSRVGMLMGGAMMAFGSGTRWLLLFLPHKILLWLGAKMQMLGSGASSGATLADALQHAWAMDGGGPLAFPFAFANGIYPPGVINALGANGLLSYGIFALLLLTFQRWRNWGGALLVALIFSTWGLLTEAELFLICLGWAVVAVGMAFHRRKFSLPASLWRSLGVIAAGALLGLIAGGAWTDLLSKWMTRLLIGVTPPSYQTVGFQLSLPAVVSSHLGILWLFNPAQLLVALAELGPMLLALPLLFTFGLRAFRLRRWMEAAMAATAFLSLAMLFVQFNGSTGVRNTPRLYVFMPILSLFALPLALWWSAHRAEWRRVLVAALFLISIAGGIVMAGVALVAGQNPVISYYLTPLDEKMYAAHWNQLAPKVMVFDSNVNRATALFGRFTNSSYTWYAEKPEWQQLTQSPTPAKLRAAGFQYAYLDEGDWQAMGAAGQRSFQDACVRKVDEVNDSQNHFRRLLDLAACP